jgi:hydroxymethylbilane synthase
LRVRAERALNTHLNGGCQVPIACYAERTNGQIWLRGMVGDPDGSLLLTAEARGPEANPEELGIRVAKDLLSQGAQKILDAVYLGAESR